MRINRTNPEQPAAQPVQSHAPIKAQTEVNGFEPPEQEIPKENQKKPPKAAKPPKPKKEKPAKKPPLKSQTPPLLRGCVCADTLGGGR